MWVKVLAMEDKIHVNYNSLEKLFCQKTVQPAEKAEQKKKAPKEVSNISQKENLEIGDLIALKMFK